VVGLLTATLVLDGSTSHACLPALQIRVSLEPFPRPLPTGVTVLVQDKDKLVTVDNGSKAPLRLVDLNGIVIQLPAGAKTSFGADRRLGQNDFLRSFLLSQNGSSWEVRLRYEEFFDSSGCDKFWNEQMAQAAAVRDAQKAAARAAEEETARATQAAVVRAAQEAAARGAEEEAARNTGRIQARRVAGVLAGVGALSFVVFLTWRKATRRR
jgi:hypothetical protein